MQFICRVGTADGRVLREVHEARNEELLRNELERRGLHVFAVERRTRLALPWAGRGGRRRRLPLPTLLIFNQELAALLRAGLPLLQALELMLERLKDPQFRDVLTQVRDRIKTGVELSDAFAAFGDVFPPLYASTLKAGERTGELEQVIRRFVRYLQLVISARKRVVSALVYPMVLVGLSIALIFVMAVFVIPRFTVFYDSLDIELPLLTRITVGTSLFLRGNLWWLALAAAGGIWAVRGWARGEQGRLVLDRLRLRVPFLGPVLHRFSLSEFCRSLATLLGGGMPLVPSLEIAVGAVGNAWIRRLVRPSVQQVREGRALHQALETSGAFTDMAIDMVKVGEATGALDTMLGNVADFLDEEVETRMQRILSLIEPLMLVFMGIIVSLLLISVYMPLFSVLGKLQ
ncbi:MAG: type II secretion system F family protein [Thermoanaerobaculia bacterium]|nr:type II secretion system F family protein [Thermoanaerobaculia bacterium]MCZ7651986.1 type II secretion system F family protein [Thermoanaerobaculia bacterium]